MEEVIFSDGKGVGVANGCEVGVCQQLEALQVLGFLSVQVGDGLHVGLQVITFLNYLAVPLLYQCLVRRDGVKGLGIGIFMYTMGFSLFFGDFSCI